MKIRDLKKQIPSLGKDDLLAYLGLQTRQTPAARVLTTLGPFGIGLLVGAGIALLLAPKPGRELRDDIRTKVRRGKDDLVASGTSMLQNKGLPVPGGLSSGQAG